MNLVLLYGPPAAGKLTVATQFSALTGYTLLDNHKATDYLPQMFPRSEPKFETVRAQLGRKVRLLLFEAAAQNNVNLITTFAPLADGSHQFIRDIVSTVEASGGAVLIVQLLPSKEVLEQRVTNQSRKGLKTDSVERLRELAEQHPAMFETYPDVEHMVLDNSQLSPEATAKLIADRHHLLEPRLP